MRTRRLSYVDELFRLSTRTTPAGATRALHHFIIAVMAPVCVTAEARAAPLRPGCSRTMNWPAARARRASARKRCGWRNLLDNERENACIRIADQVLDENLRRPLAASLPVLME